MLSLYFLVDALSVENFSLIPSSWNYANSFLSGDEFAPCRVAILVSNYMLYTHPSHISGKHNLGLW
jgi:hypothetical protein